MRNKYIILIISFLVLTFYCVPAKALGGNVWMLYFSDSNRTIQFGYATGFSQIDFRLSAVTTGIDSMNINVYDVNGNLLTSGTTGTISLEDSSIFPISFEATATTPSYWSIDMTIEATKEPTIADLIPFVDGMEGKLDALGDKIDAVKGKIQELKDELVSLDNYLTDSQPFYNSMNNLNNSVSSLQNKGFMGQIQSLSGNLNSFDVNSPSSAGMPTNLNINVTFPGIGTFNVLDLSQFAMLISFIRKLMTAMLWIGLLLYFIQYVMPRFKV